MTIELTRKPASATNGGEFDASLAQTVPITTLTARNTSGITIQNSALTTIGTIGNTGGFAFGTSGSFTNNAHTFHGGLTINGGGNTLILNKSGVPAFLQLQSSGSTIASIGGKVGGGVEFYQDTNAEVGSYNSAGVWTFGTTVTTGARITHTINVPGATGDGSLSLLPAFGAGNSGQKVYYRCGGMEAGTVGNGTYPWPYINLNVPASGEQYYWTNGALRTSSVLANVGGGGGTVVGDQTSDERLKQNITPTKYGLDTILDLIPIDFEMDGVAKVGFGAQTTLPIVPEAVYDTGEPLEDSTKLAMSYATITPILVKAIQELKAELDTAKARIATLEGNS